MTLQQSFDLAVQHHQVGRLGEAEVLYRGILAHDPNQPDALHLLGVVALQSGRHQNAVDFIQRAIELRPQVAHFHNNQGNAWMSLGQFDAAALAFRTALQLRPDYEEAHYNLGLVLQKQGLFAEAVAEYRTALRLKPDYADAWQNLGLLLMEQGRLVEAASALQTTLRFRPLDAGIHYHLGNSLLDQGRNEAAAAAYHTAIKLRPDYAEAHYYLGVALHNEGQIEAANVAYQTALRFKPNYAAARSNLGKALLDLGRIDAAIDAFHAALKLKPDHAETHYNLGNALLLQDQREAALNAYRSALGCNPLFLEAYNNLGNLLQQQDEVDEAIATYRRALAVRPDSADLWGNLGTALKNQGRFDQALDSYRQAVALKPGDAGIHSNLIYLLYFDPGYDARGIREEQARWNERHAVPLRAVRRPHSNRPDPSRRLRIGYVSTDLRDHVVGRNVLPLFRQHDRTRFDIVCYSSLVHADALHGEFLACADQWRETIGISDERLAEQIREDGVDVLVDLSLHMAHNRLPVFARQPAPVQMTFAGYPGSTGLETIRYRLTDPFLDPSGQNDPFYSEESIRLPDSFWCFDPLEDRTEVNDLPALSEGHVTFGCLNNFCKTNEATLALWARVLVKVAGSRLLLLAPRGERRGEILEFLKTRGVDAPRVEFLTKGPRSQYLQWHHRIDMMMDTFPYNGHTTSLDALWMGVPVVSLVGEHAVSRAGFSQMSNLNLMELMAFSQEEYVSVAVELAHDLARLAGLRATLRPRMQASPLMDAPRFARNIEAAYRTMWQRWCIRK